MLLSDINPFLRYAYLQPALLEGALLRAAYDYRLIYVAEGEALLLLEKQEIAVSPGTVIYLRPGMPYNVSGKIKVYMLNFDLSRRNADRGEPRAPDILPQFCSDLIFENDPPAELENYMILKNAFDLEQRFQNCVTHFKFPNITSDMITSGIIKELLGLLLQNEFSATSKNTELVQQILLYIQKNYDRKIQNADISAAFGYHPLYLNRVFKESTGITLHQAVINERIRIAKGFLRKTTLSVEEIVKEIGFSDRTQFCTAFHKITGVTPRDYRKMKKT